MNTEGTHDARNTHSAGIPHPAAPPGPPAAPPMPKLPPGLPASAEAGEPPLVGWLRAPRPEAEPGIWRYGHRVRPAEEPDRAPTRQLVSGAVISFLCGWLLWSLLWNGYLGGYWMWPLVALTPDSWRQAGGDKMAYVWASYLYYGLVIAAFLVVFGRLGRWAELGRRLAAPVLRSRAEHAPQAAPAPAADGSLWPAVREGGAPDAAEKLAAETRSGRMNDVDAARIERAWRSVQAGRNSLASFTDTVLRHGATACAHPSGLRDLPHRGARHDLLTDQVRIGTAPDDLRNPYQHRGAGIALQPALLGTSLLAVGPPGSGKTSRLTRPVVEAMSLQALAGRTAVVAVGAAGAELGPDAAFDAIVRAGRTDSPCDLDLYGGATDPDEAAAVLAEALVGDVVA
ncbi:ATP-binding protein, partial [Streptomyces purpurogeneiscleroticus]|nr:ATP-binding protein [Streptomyces purpurogeneiscleroticus]